MSFTRLLENLYAATAPVPAVASGRVLVPSEIESTGASIAALQLPSGMIPWFEGGHCDPWNHVETAMALDLSGFSDEAFAALCWLEALQHDDGSWYQYYLSDTEIEDDKFDANTIAYIATGVWCRYLIHRDVAELERFWPMVSSAVDWVLELQTERGDIIWARHSDGSPFDFSLLTGSCSIFDSLRAACQIAVVLDTSESLSACRRWSQARERLRDAIAMSVLDNEPVFEPKDRWAMDWYYPVLSGAVTGLDAIGQLAGGYDRFVIAGKGVRCVSDQDWVTSAETSEAAMAYWVCGQVDIARDLFLWAQVNRHDSGAYYTGYACPEKVYYPDGQLSSYTAAAVILCWSVMGATFSS